MTRDEGNSHAVIRRARSDDREEAADCWASSEVRLLLLDGSPGCIWVQNRAILDSKMTIQTKSIMKRRVNRVQPSGLVCP
jgi:hypothetical protein